jgi:5-methylcytosine-specific restriction protein B
MFLTKKAIEKAFPLLIKLDTQQGRQGKSRKEKVSALRHLLATSLVLKKFEPAKKLDLSVGPQTNRDDFVKAVGEVVSIDDSSNYTCDFAGEFAEKADFAVGNNFLTTKVADSRDNRHVEYPRRPTPLLDITNEKMSIKRDVKDALEKSYNLNEIRAPLAIWLLRTTEFPGNLPPTLHKFITAISSIIESKFEPLVAAALNPTQAEWESFFNETGLTIQELLGVSKINHASVLVEHSSLHKQPTNFNNIADSASIGFGVAGLKLRKATIQRFIASLLAKRFLILTGLSGSGKTKLAHAFAVWIAESEEQYCLAAVGADWTTNENVLGYQDALQTGVYRKPSNGALDVILRARNDLERPYFLILDEMNLSHVERYFADILSAIESGQEIALHSADSEIDGVPTRIVLPENLFIIGTVNVDETTYMFSPKVLDRANVIEFRATADDIAAFLDAPSKVDMGALASKGAAFGIAFVEEAKADAQLGSATAAEFKERLTEIFSVLAPIGAEFGFRTAYEITRFTHFHAKLSGEGWQLKDALDAQVLQKLLPKLHGSERRLGPVLKALETFCMTHECDDSLKKIRRMQDRLKDGFTSFAEA